MSKQYGLNQTNLDATIFQAISNYLTKHSIKHIAHDTWIEVLHTDPHYHTTAAIDQNLLNTPDTENTITITSYADRMQSLKWYTLDFADPELFPKILKAIRYRVGSSQFSS